MVDHIEALHNIGLDFITYDRGLKGPSGLVAKGWQLKPKATIAQLRAAGICNYGIRLGGWSKVGDRYLVGLDVDIRDPAAAPACHAWLDEFVPEWRTLPSVISGSGGASRHIYGTFAKAPTKTRTVMGSGDGWNVDVRGNTEGNGCQNVWPGSLHPSGGLYEFERPFDVARIAGALDDADMIGGEFPTGIEFNAKFERQVFEKIGEIDTADEFGDEDDDSWLMREARDGRYADYTLDQARAALDVFPDEWWIDRDRWRNAGMALKHQFGGGAEPFDLWCEMSQKVPEKFNLRDAQSQWRSFKSKPGVKPITMGTILQESNAIQIKAAFGGDEPADDIDDMIGGAAVADAPLPALPAPTCIVAELPHDEDWRDRLKKVNKAKKAKDGEPEPEPILVLTPGLPNTLLLVEYDIRLRGVLAYNAFAQSVVLVRDARRKKSKPGKHCYQLEGKAWKLQNKRNGDAWSDSREHAIRAMIETPDNQGGYSMKVADRDLHSAIDIIANKRQFHPVQEYIKAEAWDGIARIDNLFIDYLGCDNTPYHRAASRTTILAAVTRIFEPGHKFDYAPIIEGAQGKGKSTFISVLSHNWFSELSSEFTDDKKMVESMKGSWIIEIGELSGFSRHDVDIIKQFISRREDKVRMAYARNVDEFPRQCIFIGSTNNRRYLRDETGARRFWPIECKLTGMIDNIKLKTIVGQVWAEAYVIYQQMRAAQPDGWLPLYLTDREALLEAEVLQESRRVETADDATLGQIQRWLNTPIKGDGMDEAGETGTRRKVTCLIEIAVHALGIPKAVYVDKPALAQQLSRVMTRVNNWKASGDRMRFDDWGQQRFYEFIGS